MKKDSGFTIVELLVTLVIIGTLLAVGGPSLKVFRQNNQLVASANELVAALHVARSEAIKNNSRVSICESSDGSTCSSTGEWVNGWIVFVDANGDFSGTGAKCTAIGTDCLLRAHEGFSSNELTIVGLDGNGVAITGFTYTSRGLPKDVNGIAQSGVFNICSLDDSGTTTNARAVVMNLSGRVRVSDNAAVITQCP